MPFDSADNNTISPSGKKALRVYLDIDQCSDNNKGCVQNCSNTNGSYACICGAGYELSFDQQTCTDVNECSANNGGCAQNCTNTNGSFTCGCETGYTLATDHLSCTSTAKPRKDVEKSCTQILVTVQEVAVRTALTLSRSKGEIKLQEAQDYESPILEEHELHAQLKNHSIKWIPRMEIMEHEKIGCGQFGDLHEGVWTSSGTEREVAIEALSSGNPDSKIKFLQEATIVAQLNHPNVIRLIGIITEDKPLTLIFELAHSCNLSICLALLKAQMEGQGPTNAFGQLLSYSQQIACGLQYLSSKSLSHSDLSAQKILVTDNNICKIADVGSRSQVAEEDYYVPGVENTSISLYTAPEAILYKKYSTASDVWSYGCLLYEIWSVGRKLYEGMVNESVIDNIDTGYRLPPPPGCPLMIYYIMIECWNPDASLRPLFSDIYMSLFQNQNLVCQIPNEALLTHSQAGVLGAPLEAGKNMYLDIQKTYTNKKQ
eukprot:Em0011g737a